MVKANHRKRKNDAGARRKMEGVSERVRSELCYYANGSTTLKGNTTHTYTHTPELLSFRMRNGALSKNLVYLLVKLLLNVFGSSQEINCPGAHCKEGIRGQKYKVCSATSSSQICNSCPVA